ncbi:hypothetical protein VM57_11105 [Stenotrophomonas maltophilia]|uniref:Uncharacterized protein n=1 Tax=Stenotrophomonas maltophilia TaxID=40324 RepID=A0A0F5ZNR7_STEMA|nr:hypothetical protein VM57_11105 [Stenotrophomonas maltophilia]
MAIALAGMLAQRVDLQLQLRADVLEHLRRELRQGAGALITEDLRNVAAGDDRRFVNGAMVLVMILTTHRVDAAWFDQRADLFDRRNDVVAAGGESRVRESCWITSATPGRRRARCDSSLRSMPAWQPRPPRLSTSAWMREPARASFARLPPQPSSMSSGWAPIARMFNVMAVS